MNAPGGRVSFAASAEEMAGTSAELGVTLGAGGAGGAKAMESSDFEGAGSAAKEGVGVSPMSPVYWEHSQHHAHPPVEPSARRKVCRATPAVTRSKAAEVFRSGVVNAGLKSRRVRDDCLDVFLRVYFCMIEVAVPRTGRWSGMNFGDTQLG